MTTQDGKNEKKCQEHAPNRRSSHTAAAATDEEARIQAGITILAKILVREIIREQMENRRCRDE